MSRCLKKNRGFKRRGLWIPLMCVILTLVSFASTESSSGEDPKKSEKREEEQKAIKPIEAIKELDKIAESYRVGKNLTEEDREFNRNLKQRILRGTFDLRELAKLSLAKHWEEISSTEQDQFVELLISLLEERSVFAKEKALEKGEEKSYSVSYHGQDYKTKEKRDALAKTTVRLKKKGIKVSLNYKLKRDSTVWKIYDVIMDDASLVANYRYSFGKIIEKHGYPELIRRMKDKLKEFRTKRAAQEIPS